MTGLAEILVGLISNSIGLMADGVHSFADALVTILVITGIRLSKRAPDGRFHHGYGRAENLFGLLAAVVMVVVGGIVFYESYLVFLTPETIYFSEYATVTAVIAFIVGLIIAFYKIKLANRTGSPALRVDAYNSIKDFSASLVVIIGITLSSYGYYFFDAVAGIIISILIFSVGYISIKESSIVLMDGCLCTDRNESIIALASTVKGIKSIRDLKFRKVGRDMLLEAVVELEGDKTVNEAHGIVESLKAKILEDDEEIGRVTVEIAPYNSNSTLPN